MVWKHERRIETRSSDAVVWRSLRQEVTRVGGGWWVDFDGVRCFGQSPERLGRRGQPLGHTTGAVGNKERSSNIRPV